MNQVLRQAKKIVTPSNKLQHEKTKVAKIAFELIQNEARKYPQVVDVEFGGSYAKGTWLPEKADIDIFIKFKKLTSEKKFVAISKKIGFNALKKFNPYERYSEHPYVEAHINNTRINVVPCYDVEKGKWKSSADRSSFHTKFMLESLTGQMKNDVRLLKEFLKSNNIYGAEIAKQGFSGYVTEVLIWNFGSFEVVIKKISKIQVNQVIGNASKKFDTPIVIMDPIDSNRNLAAAISAENIGKFVLICRAFMKKPTISFFKTKLRTISKKNLDNVIVIKFNFKPRSPDIIWGQIKRAANALSVQMEIEGFKVLRNSAYTNEKNETSLLFKLQSIEIEDEQVKEGPDFFNELDSSKFITKNYKKTNLIWIGNKGKILSLQKRNQNNAKLFLQDLLKNHLNKSGIPRGLKSDMKKGIKFLDAYNIKDKSIKESLTQLVSTDATIFYSNQ